MWFFLAGGAPMIVIVLFGLVALGAAARFAYEPQPARLGYIAALCVAVLFSVPAALAADLIAVCTHVPANPEWAHSPDLPLILLEGLGEALTPVVLGFSVLAVVALVSAVGLRRMPLRLA